MPEFRLQDRIQDVGAVNPGIVSPVQDTATAQAISDIGNLAIEGAKGFQRIKGQQLGEQVEQEIYDDVFAQQQALQAKNFAVQEGAKLGAAKAHMGETQFKARAEAKLKTMMAENPFFSEEIAAGFAETTGFDPRGAGLKAAFELARVQGQTQMSPEEKAMQADRQRKTEFALTHNVSVEQADLMMAKEAKLQFQTNVQAQSVALGKTGQRTLYSRVARDQSAAIISELSEVLNSQEGDLTPDQVNEFKNKINRLAIEFPSTVAGFLADKDQHIADHDSLNAEAERMKGILTEYVENKDRRSTVKNNLELIQDTLSSEVLKNQNYAKFYALKQTLGETVVAELKDSLDSEAFKNYKGNNVILRDVFKMFSDEEDSVSAAMDSLNRVISGEPPSELDANVAAFALKDPKFRKALSQEQIDAIEKTVPGILKLHTTKAYEGQIKSGEMTIKDVDGSIRTHLGALMRQYPTLSGSSGMVKDIQIRETRIRGGRAGGISVVDQDGTPVHSRIYTGILNALELTEKYPELWEGSFEDPEEYVKSIFLGPNFIKEEEPEETPNEPEAPEVSLSPEEERSLKIALAEKQYPELDRATIEGLV